MPTVNVRAFSHKKSTVVENGGPKLPTAAQLELGEIAINFAKGYETLSIKNNNDEIVTFTNDNYWINKELAIAAALNDLNDRVSNKQDALEMDETPTEGSQNVVTSGGLYSYITEIEHVTAAALNDLNDRITSLALSDDYAAAAQGTPPLAGDTYETAISKLHKVIVDDELITSSALNDLNSRIDNLSLSEDYEATDPASEPAGGDTYEEAIGKLHGAILENELATSGALNDLNTRISDIVIPELILSEDYEPSSLSNDDLFLAPGDSYETAFAKLEKTINDNENITSAALTDLDSRLNLLHLPQSLDDIPDGSTRKLSNYATTTQLATKQDTLISGTNIKTINNLSLLGTGNINVSNIEIIEVNANIRADVTKDGTITVDDTTEITRNITSSTNNLQYDVNNDGNVTIADVSLSSNIALNKPHNLYIDIETNPYSLITTSFNNSKIPILRLVFPGNLIKDILIQKTNNTPVYYGEDIYAIQIPSSGNGINLSETILKIFVQISETEANGIIGHIVTKEGLATKQDTLVSGTNIKTINNESILGSGNITIQGGSGGDTNVIETVKVNGTALTPDANKAVDVTVPIAIYFGTYTQNTNATGVNDMFIFNLTTPWATIKADVDNGKEVILIFDKSDNNGTGNRWEFYYTNTEAASLLEFESKIFGYPCHLTYDNSGGISLTISQFALSSDLSSVATSGNYNDLTNKPTIPAAVTESTVSGWGFTKNTGTITGITMNGVSKGTSGVVDLGTVATANNYVTGGSVNSNNGTISLTRQGLSAASVTGLNTYVSNLIDTAKTATGGYDDTYVAKAGDTMTGALTVNAAAATTVNIIGGDNSSGNQIALNVGSGTHANMFQVFDDGSAHAVVNGTLEVTPSSGQTGLEITVGAATDTALTTNGKIIANQFVKSGGTSGLLLKADGSVMTFPAFSSADNGKVLSVVNGSLAWVTPTSIYSGTSEPDSNTGNNGDLYLQTS